MVTLNNCQELVEQVTLVEPRDIGPAALRIAAFCESIGFRVGATIDISSRNDLYDANGSPLMTTAFGWSDPSRQWWNRPQLALNSPIALACRYETEPFWCNRDGSWAISNNPELAAISFERFFDSYPHLNALIMVPVRLSFGRIGVASLTPLDEDRTDLSDAYHSSATAMTAIFTRFLSTYSKLMDDATPVPSACRLTRREVQCLHWASRGKTDNETATILGISHAAVRYHISKVSEKLDCVNRTQAVFKAGQLGYLTSI